MALWKAPKLKTLSLDGNKQLGDDGAKLLPLHCVGVLRYLSLAGCGINGRGMKYLRILPQLIELTLDDNSLGDDGATLLRRNSPSSLKRLSLAGCNITADGLKSLSFDLLNFDRLDVSRNCFSANEARQVLGKACKGMKLLKEGNQVVFESRSRN